MFNTIITEQNKDAIANIAGISRKELEEKLYEAKKRYEEEQNLEFQKNFFSQDEEGIKKIKEKVKQIRNSLPKNISERDRTIAMYGWIEKETKITKTLFAPDDDTEFIKAILIKNVLNGNIELYHRMVNWD